MPLQSISLDQWKSLGRTLVPFIGGILVARGVMNATQFDSLVNQIGTIITDVTVLAGMVAPIATAVWGMISHNDANKVAAAAALPGIKVVVDDKAADSVKTMVADPAQPNVVKALGSP